MIRFRPFALLLALAGCSSAPGNNPAVDGGGCGAKTSCSGVCVDLATDAANCGGCGNACTGGEGCVAGKCVAPCMNGQTMCGGKCVDLASDPAHCGDCKTACTNGLVCSAGQCQVNCDMPLVRCGQSCVDTTMDADHCGACDMACPPLANAARACVKGACVLAACNPGFADCDGLAMNGCEVATDADLKNCGACGKVCQNVANGTPGCAKGVCGIGNCLVNFADCDGNPVNGCEASVLSDVGNCGTCGNACGQPANGVAACTNGSCTIASCNAGFVDCDGKFANGCEVNVAGDPMNCGGCGKACKAANATPLCANGACALGPCSAGFADCDKVIADGCEIAVSGDLANCGTCGHACSAPNGAPSCMGGACGIASCNKGFADCDGQAGDGCEVNIAGDVKNCGACGSACPAVANATGTCAGGACAIGSCNLGFLDCDGQVGDGCEVDGRSDAKNCGTCGKVCALANATSACTNSQCTISLCVGNFRDCDAIAANGCETDVTSSANNCGACGKSCFVANGTGACTNSTCGVGGCNAGFADCDGNFANGCEARLASDLKNCGGCGVACGGGFACVGGACKQGLANVSFAGQVTYSTGTQPWAPALGDLNGDGKLDVVVTNRGGNTVWTYLGSGTGTLGAPVSRGTAGGPAYPLVVNLNNDGKPDVVVAGYDSGLVGVHLGNGDGTLGFSTLVGSTGTYCPASADFNGDGKADLAVTAFGGGAFIVYPGNGDGTFGNGAATAIPGPIGIAAADLNGDGKVDLVVGDNTDNTVRVYLGNGNGTFGGPTSFATGTSPSTFAVADFNLDNKLDLAVPNFGSGSLGVLLGNGDGTFKPQTLVVLNGSPHTAVAADFNLDGLPDLAVTNAGVNNLVHVLIGNGNGTFKPAINLATGADPRGCAAGDLSGDGRPDIVVADSQANLVSVLLNTSQ